MNKRRKIKKYNTRKYSPTQLWNLDYYLAKHIYYALKQFKAMERHGYPGCYGADTPEKWEEILDKMIWSFKEISEDFRNQPLFSRDAVNFIVKDEDGHSVLSFDDDDEQIAKTKIEREAYTNKLNEGLSLFGKYFYHLWD